MSDAQLVTVSTKIPIKMLETIDAQCYNTVGEEKVKMRDRSDILRELIIEGMVARGLIEIKKVAEQEASSA
jgi:hypothetical protein